MCAEAGGTGHGQPGAAEQGSARRTPGRTNAFLVVLVFLALAFHPTQITVRQWAELLAAFVGFGRSVAVRVPGINVTVSDCLIVLAFLLWLARLLAGGRVWQRIRSYPLALVGLFGCAALSAVPQLKPAGVVLSEQNSVLIKAGAKEIVQLGVLLVCGYAVLADVLRSERWRTWLVRAFVIACAAAVAVGLWEYARLRPGELERAHRGAVISPTEIDATFGLRAGQTPDAAKTTIATASNRNVLGAWVSLAVPLLWGVALWGRRRGLRIGCAALALAAMPLLLQGGLWAVTLFAVLLVSFVRGRWWFVGTGAVLTGLWTAIFLFGPQHHGPVLLDSLMLRKQFDRFYTLRLYRDDATRYATRRLGAELDGSENGSSAADTDVTVAQPEPNRQPEDLDFGPLHESEWQQRFVEWQPGLQALARSPLFGRGLGYYQQMINSYYEASSHRAFNPDMCYRVPKKRGYNLMEFGGNSGWLVWLTSTGLVGLVGMLWFLMSSIGRAVRAGRSWTPGIEKGLALGSIGSLAAMAGGMFFTEYMVRGVGVALVFVLAVGGALCEDEPCGSEGEPPPQAPEHVAR